MVLLSLVQRLCGSDYLQDTKDVEVRTVADCRKLFWQNKEVFTFRVVMAQSLVMLFKYCHLPIVQDKQFVSIDSHKSNTGMVIYVHHDPVTYNCGGA
jgi:hypothetical protein